MQRDINSLTTRRFDLLVVGGGIYGACTARDAALRGLDVALIEQSDFSSATSHNSGKIVHGGIRYLQHLDFRRMRESLAELGVWLAIAPHLVKPMEFVIPAQGYLMRGPAALLAGVIVHRLTGLGTQRSVPESLKTRMGRIYRKSTLQKMIPGLPPEGLTGAASWYDGQLVDADRVVLECVQAASDIGAVVANHVVAESLLMANGKVEGIAATDRIGGRELEIRAKTTVITGGPWARSFLGKVFGSDAQALAPPLAKNMNIVVPQLLGDYGIGIPSQRKSDAVIGSESRLYFVAPWKDVSIIGTTHFPYDGAADSYKPDEEEIQEFLDELNSAYPRADLSLDQVHYVYSGLTPADPDSIRAEVGRSKRAEVIDHSIANNADGLITVIGVKYTTARLVAERVIDLVERRMGRRPNGKLARTRPLPGALDLLNAEAIFAKRQWGADPIADLIYPFGSGLPASSEGDTHSFEAAFEFCARHSVRNEMALTLDDLLLRRFDLVERGLFTDKLFEIACNVLADELGWNSEAIEQQISDFRTCAHKSPYLSKILASAHSTPINT
jgi:glycerol-3-phosphate dehydrogenase